MPLDPQAQMLLEQLAMLEEFYEPSLAEIRRRSSASSSMNGTLEPVQQIKNLTLEGPGGPIPVRIYTPQGEGPFPVLVYFHGGGWIVGSLDMVEPICRSLANSARCIVVSPSYRLAPENKFPAALEDALAVTQWTARTIGQFQGDPARLAVGGDSAGGNLAAVISQIARDQGGPALIYQLLLYPQTDLSAPLDPASTGLEHTMLTIERATFHTASYVRSQEDELNPQGSPLLADSLANLPPALVITTEYDLMRDQGRLYAERLQASGVSVTYKHYGDMMHGFISMATLLDRGKQALQEVGEILQSALYQPDLLATRPSS